MGLIWRRKLLSVMNEFTNNGIATSKIDLKFLIVALWSRSRCVYNEISLEEISDEIETTRSNRFVACSCGVDDGRLRNATSM